LKNGPIPAGAFVLHKCDNPPCVNPAHLFLGTQAENVADRDRKGRQATGDRHGRATHPERTARKLTTADVERIRERRASGKGRNALAAEYGVHPVTIQRITHPRPKRST
jgi:hypothetical protein